MNGSAERKLRNFIRLYLTENLASPGMDIEMSMSAQGRAAYYQHASDDKDGEVIGEPDLSSEDERDDDDDIDEINTVAAAGVRGHMASGKNYDPEKPDYSKYEKNKK